MMEEKGNKKRSEPELNRNNSNNIRTADRSIFTQIYYPIRRFFNYFRSLFCNGSIDSADGRATRIFRHWINGFRNFFRRNCLRRLDSYSVNSYPKLVLPKYDFEREYNMKNDKRGIALIFNQEHFEPQTKHTSRLGTHVDLNKLEKTLVKLDFEVMAFTDLGIAKIIENLKKVASMDHSKNDCIIITILSHGELNKIFSRDDEYHISLITSFFTDENCPSLKGKPKIFFIQTCRGGKMDYGYKIRHSKNSQLRRINMGSFEAIDVTAVGFIHPLILEPEMVHNPPNHPDFLIVRSTMPNYVSFRNTTTGSWFIQDLCTELDKYGHDVDLLTLLTFVTNSVAMRESNPHEAKQIICTSSMLTKLLVFRTKGNLTQF